MGVWLGEAAFSPAAYAMTAQCVPSRRWGLALGALMLGASVGYGLALIGGAGVLAGAQMIQGLGLPLLGALAAWLLAFVGRASLPLLSLIPLARVTRGGPAAARGEGRTDAGAVWR